jgi:hypothetical protein
MPDTPIIDRKSSGSLRLKTGTATGPVDIFSSLNVVNVDGVVTENQNYGTAIERTHGDGRKWMGIKTATPANPTPGQYWIERVTGIDYWAFVDSAGAVRYINPAGGTSPIPTTVPLTVTSPSVNTLFTVNVDSVGIAEYTLCFTKSASGQRHLYRATIAHDGTTIADATTAQIALHAGVAVGAWDITLTVDLSGTGASQVMRVRAEAATTGWVAFYVPERMVAI